MNVYVKIAGVVLVALIAVVLVVPSFIDWNQYKSQITEPVEELTGRRLEISGDVSFAVLPAPAFSANGLSFANAEGGRATYLARVESLDIRVAFLPLLSGRIQVESIAVNNPVLALEVLAEGQSNWSFHPPNQESSASKVPDEDASIDIRFEQVVIKNGTITYDDIAAGTSLNLTDIEVIVSATSLDGPFAARGAIGYQQLPILFEVLIGNLKSSRAVPVSFSFAIEDQAAKLTFDGWASEPSADARFNGHATVEGADLADTIGKIMSVVNGSDSSVFDSVTALQEAYSAEIQVIVGSREARLRNLSMQLGDDIAAGALHVTLGAAPVFEGNLDIPSIDLDRWLKRIKETAELDAISTNTPDLGAKKNKSIFVIPEDVTGTFKLSVGEVNYNDGVARQIALALRMGDGRLGVENASALLPGGSSVSVTGVLAAEAGQPRFAGRLNAASDNLRNLLSWLDVNTDTVPPDRLTRFSYTSSVDVSPEIAQAFRIEMALDTMQATGDFSVALSDRLAFGLDLAIDDLDVDSYLIADNDGAEGESEELRRENGGSVLGKFKKQMSGLNDFDADMQLKLNRLKWAGREAKDFLANGVLYGGELAIEELRIGDYLGTAGTLTGTARDLSRRPEVNLQLDFALSEKDALRRIVGVELPSPLSHLGVGEGSLQVNGSEHRITFELDAKFSDTQVAAKGGVDAPLVAPVPQLSVSMDNHSFANLIKQFDLPFNAPSGKDDGPVELSLSALGTVDNLKMQTSLDLGGGRVSFGGNIQNPVTDPTYDFAADLKADDLRKFVRGLGINFQPAAASLGGIDASWSVSGSHIQASLKNLKGKLGPVAIKGEASVRLAGDRPRVAGSLEMSELIVDLFVAAPAAGDAAGGRHAEAAARWSKDPFDLAFLREFDGELRLRTPGIVVGNYDFRNVEADIALEDGVTTVRPLKARLFDGEAELAMELDARQMPDLNIRLSFTNADVATALAALAEIEAITGRAGFSGEFHTRGHSQMEMIAALGGGARISAREGVIRGINLPRLSDRLHKLDESKDVLSVVAGSLFGGETAYRSFESAVQVKDGVIRTTDVRTDVDAVDTTLTSEVDLVKWTMDAEARFRLTDHPKAPNVGVDLRGPIDNPRRDLKTRKLESYLTKRLAQAMLNKLIGNKPVPTVEPSQTTGGGSIVLPAPVPASPKPLAPEDILRGLLDKLP